VRTFQEKTRRGLRLLGLVAFAFLVGFRHRVLVEFTLANATLGERRELLRGDR
jgi:hypothetical protein